MLRGLIAAALGGFLGTVGLDIDATEPRPTFGFVALDDGIPLLPMTIGLLALSEIIVQIENHVLRGGAGSGSIGVFGKEIRAADRRVSLAEFGQSFRTIIRSSLIGTGIGAIPGSLSTAILIGAFPIHGVDPGPLIFKEHPRLVYGIFAAMALANLLNLLIGNLGLRFFALIVRLPTSVIRPVIVVLCVAGAFATGNDMFSVAVMMVFAILGYFMRKLDFSFATFIIGFALGNSFEVYFRQTVIMFKEQPVDLLTRPITMGFVLSTVYAVYRMARRKPMA